MEPPKVLTPEEEALAAVAEKINSEKLLNMQQEMWVDFNAVGGLLLEADGTFKKSATRTDKHGNKVKYGVSDLADDLGIRRETLYYWTQSIPSFWERVAARRKVLFAQTRTAQVWNSLFLKARSGNPQAIAMYLANADAENFRMPQQNVAHGVDGGFADLINMARERALQGGTRKVIDAEVQPNASETQV